MSLTKLVRDRPIKKHNGATLIESLVILPIFIILLVMFFIVIIKFMNKWSTIWIEEEYYYCKKYRIDKQCQKRKQVLLNKQLFNHRPK